MSKIDKKILSKIVIESTILIGVFIFSYIYMALFVTETYYIETYDVIVDPNIVGYKITSGVLNWDLFYVDLYIPILIFMFGYIVISKFDKTNISNKVGILFMILCLVVTQVLNIILIGNSIDYATYNFFNIILLATQTLEYSVDKMIINLGTIFSIILSCYFIFKYVKRSNSN